MASLIHNMRVFVAAGAFLVGVSGAALAQTNGPVGEVSNLAGPSGSVLVIRGNVTYTLQAGDKLFAGDRVFTRTNGSVDVKYYQCALALAGAQSIDIQSNCGIGAVTLSADASVGGVAIGTAAGGVGATPILLSTALLAAGAAALGDDGPSSP